MEQSKAMEYESGKASSDVLKPRYIYTHTHIIMYEHGVTPYAVCYAVGLEA